ncbi:MAG: GntR family transcriptional regulator [Firmicutes bacterium]|nr:GntR family transcriptional regulator [Blautia sp.]MDD7370636.1 GntR family transcriptional regulator [Bacillota bacterium]MDY3716083.1 GntR family transcriptional regulator [Blautia sp.]
MAANGKSLRGQVFDKIRSDILKGRYQKGDELVECTIGKEMGVSRTPVREAIRQLELEGLVQLIPNKGAFVTGISASDVRDIYLIRSRLEGLAARMAAEHISSEQLAEMEETIVLSDYHVKKEHFEQVCEMDGKFHKLLYAASGSRILEHTLTDFHQYVQRVRMASITNRIRMHKSNSEHEKILEAIRNKDGDQAEKVAAEHISNTVENLKQYDLDRILQEK